MKRKMVMLAIMLSILLIVPATSYQEDMANNSYRQRKSDAIATTSTSNGNILYVGGSGPDNYTKIKDAINDANDGDTVFVYDNLSPYYENIDVDKSISLIGESRDTTIINGNGSWAVINVTANDVIIINFTIQNGMYEGIHIYSHYNNISHNNIIKNGWDRIYLDHSISNHILWNSIISTDGWAIHIDYSNNNVIANNIIDSNERGISVMYSDNNQIMNNTISNHTLEGINIWTGNNNIISSNIFSDNEEGISLCSSGNTVSSNSFYRDGIIIFSSPNTVINNTVNGKTLL